MSTPIERRLSATSQYIDANLLANNLDEGARIQRITKTILHGAGLVVSFLANPPLIYITGKNPSPYDDFTEYSSVVSSSLLASWTIFETVDVYMEPLGEKEYSLTNSKQQKWKTVATALSCITFGILFQTPVALLYAQEGEAIPSSFTSIVSNSWLPIFSLTLLTSTRALKYPFISKETRALENTRKNLRKMVQSKASWLASLNSVQRSELQKSISTIRKIENQNERIDAFIKFLILRDTSHNSKLTSSIEKLIYCFGLTVAAALLVGMAQTAYLGSRIIIESPVACAFFAVGLTFIASYMPLTIIPQSLLKNFKYKPTLSDRIAPKFSIVGKSLAATASLLSYGPAVSSANYLFSEQNTGDYYLEGVPQKAMMLLLPCAVIPLATEASFKLVNEIAQRYILKRGGSKEDKDLVLLNKNLNRLYLVINKLPADELSRFDSDIQSLRNSLLSEVSALEADETTSLLDGIN